MQVPGASVIAEPSPEAQDIINRCLREVRYFGEPRHEALVVRNHCRHLRLLQHDL